ncbi:hypothetical protein Fsol_00421 [Candidatus Fokinia solitaria]|uniref:Uncharacterized protein n=1 Tax=Candidatus Fokinia solitaria TaxID=1802984 RepID=A0A2U8BS77_9RICK|nr:hypothetical protein [Candidatus Fokinia solitaria]AWD33216.1 hypothetical protein Fsol_00421 [Candidatus Fokinia solitaria]
MSSTNIILCDHKDYLSNDAYVSSERQFSQSYITALSLFQNTILNLRFYDKFTQPMLICTNLAYKNTVISQLHEIGVRKAILLCEDSIYGSAVSLMLAIQYLLSVAAMTANHQVICTMLSHIKTINFDLFHTHAITKCIAKAKSNNMHLSKVLCFAAPTNYFDENTSYIEIKGDKIIPNNTLHDIKSFPETPYSKKTIAKIKNSIKSYSESPTRTAIKGGKNNHTYLSEIGVYYSSLKVLCDCFQLHMSDCFQETKKLFTNDDIKTERSFIIKEISTDASIQKVLSSYPKYNDFSQSILRYSDNAIVCTPEDYSESVNWNEVYHTSKMDIENAQLPHLNIAQNNIASQEREPVHSFQAFLHQHHATFESKSDSQNITYECQDSAKIIIKELKAKYAKAEIESHEKPQSLTEKRVFTMYSFEDLLHDFLAHNISENITLSDGNILFIEKPMLLMAQDNSVIWEFDTVIIVAHKKYIHIVRNVIKDLGNSEEAYEILQQLFETENKTDKALLKMILEEHKNSFIF